MQLLHWTSGHICCIWVATVADHFEEMGGDCSGATPLRPPVDGVMRSELICMQQVN